MKKVILSFAIMASINLMGCSSKSRSEEINDSVVNREIKGEPKKEVSKINIGTTYTFDTYHKIKFKSENRYLISQPYGCVGEGNYSIVGENIMLGPNNSDCESTRKINGEFSIDQIVN
jgi:hypothetical protein